MKKTTKYARKRAAGHTYNSAEFLNVIDRCRPYTDERAKIIQAMYQKQKEEATC